MTTLKFDLRSISRDLRADIAGLERELPRALLEHGQRFEREVKDRQFGVQLEGPWKRNPGGNGVASRTGALRQSIRTRVEGSGLRSSMVSTVGDARTGDYVGVQEDGATIVGSPWLAIPAPANLTPAGVPRYPSPRALKGDKDNPTFIRKLKSGNLGIFRRTAGNAIELLWLLKRQVVIPPRLGFLRTFESPRMDRDRVKRIERAIDRALGT